jgi:hypothetical protein
MYTIKTSKGYITVRPGQSQYSFTSNKNFAYTYDTEREAQGIINLLGLEAEIEIL